MSVSLAKPTVSMPKITDPARNHTVTEGIRARKISRGMWMLRTNDPDSLADWFAIHSA